MNHAHDDIYKLMFICADRDMDGLATSEELNIITRKLGIKAGLDIKLATGPSVTFEDFKAECVGVTPNLKVL